MSQPTPSQPIMMSFAHQESSGSVPMNSTEHCTLPGGETQNAGLVQAEVIANLTQKKLDDVQKLGMRIRYHEDNLKFLKIQMKNLDDPILDLQVNLGKYRRSCVAALRNNMNHHSQTEKETVDQILKQEKSAAGVLCQLKSHHGTLASELPFTKDVLGIVATLGKVADDNISRLFSEYLGLDTMTAIVCKTYEGVKALELYDEEGNVKINLGLCGLGPSIGRQMDGRFLAICLEDLRPYVGVFVADDLQRKLALQKPRLPNGECPPGFLGFAVNMISLDFSKSYVTASGRGLRETLFYNLFSRLQVYRSRGEMLLALPCISDGALSLDGGMIRTSGMFSLGNRNDVEVRFPLSTELSNLPVNYLEAEQQIQMMIWEKERLGEDIEREEALLTQTNMNFASKKEEYLRFVTENAPLLNQHPPG